MTATHRLAAILADRAIGAKKAFRSFGRRDLRY
jgi:hypothetical protein